MDQYSILVFCILGSLFLSYIFYSRLSTKVTQALTKVTYLEKENTHLQTELQQERHLLKDSQFALNSLDKEHVLIKNQLDIISSRYQELLENKSADHEKFEQLATKIIQAKTDTFDRQHKEGIKEILEPLKERIKTFEDKVDLSVKESIERHSSLKSQLFHLRELNEKITFEASNLTKALKGDNKVQGNWGELILESILSKSGLEKDREYFTQQTINDANGRMQRPDVIIALPDGKRMIIDSKVSLKAYEAMVSADDKESQTIAAKAHLKSIKNHVDGLASKNYHDLYEMESPDFVLMFVPIDTAFAAAVQSDDTIYAYAFEKNIVIVTPTTLLATLKTVDTIWNNDKQHRNALEIATEAGKMYDKLANLADDLIAIGKRLDQTKDAYQESMKKLVHGKGNLIGRAQKVKALGAKANKGINESLVKRLD